MADRVEEPLDIGVENPPDVPSLDPERERVQRIVLAAPRSEPIAEAQELRLVDRRQGHDHRRLYDFILDGGDAERPLLAVRLRDIHPPRRQRSIRSRMDAPMEIEEADPPVLPRTRPTSWHPLREPRVASVRSTPLAVCRP